MIRRYCVNRLLLVCGCKIVEQSARRTLYQFTRVSSIVNTQAGSGSTTARKRPHHVILPVRDLSTDATNVFVDPQEVDKFNKLANEWWKPGGEFDALHSMNELRVPFVRDGLLETNGADMMERKPRPLEQFTLLDIGCGGGILSEPLARLGAKVTGLDASEETIAMARWHATQDPALSGNLNHICSSLEDLGEEYYGSFDGLIASEVLEHVNNQREFVSTCCRLVKDGGSIFFTTLNKTWLSYALGIVAAERILRIVPDGTHDWDKFVDKDTLKEWLEENGFHVRLVHGMLLNPISNRWRWISDSSVNYAVHAVKMFS